MSGSCPAELAEQAAARCARRRHRLVQHDRATGLATRRVRKLGIHYSRFHPSAAEVRNDFIRGRSLHVWTAVLARHYATDSPGVWPAPDNEETS